MMSCFFISEGKPRELVPVGESFAFLEGSIVSMRVIGEERSNGQIVRRNELKSLLMMCWLWYVSTTQPKVNPSTVYTVK